MTLTELQYCIALEAERHFRKAAERCFVSQPTLSIAIKRLEEELGQSLFERANIQPTDYGKRVLSKAKAMMALANDIKLDRNGSSVTKLALVKHEDWEIAANE